MIIHANHDRIAELAASLRADGKRIVFTNGVFDILHAGHVTYLEKARALGDVLVVGLNTDASVRRLKGPERPINSEDDRACVIAALRAVDHVILFGDAMGLRGPRATAKSPPQMTFWISLRLRLASGFG